MTWDNTPGRLRNRAIVFVLALGLGALPATSGKTSTWTPKESVELRNFSTDPAYPEDWATPSARQAIVPSPNGRYFFFTITRGDAKTNQSIGTLYLYRVHELAAAIALGPKAPHQGKLPYVAPLAALTFTNDASKFGPFANIRWQDDSSGIILNAALHEDSGEVWRIEAATGGAHRMASAKGRIIASEVHGPTTYYQTLATSDWIDRICREPYPVPWWDSCRGSSVRRAFVALGDRTLPVDFHIPKFSPDGQHVLAIIDNGAGKLSDLKVNFVLASAPSFGNKPIATLATGFDLFGSFWSNDGKHLLLAPVQKPGHLQGFIADYEIATGKMTYIEQVEREGANTKPVPVEMAAAVAGDVIAVRYRLATKDAGTTYFVFGPKGWRHQLRSNLPEHIEEPANDLVVGGVRIWLDQDLNRPPVMRASSDGKEVRLTLPDPVLTRATRAPVEAFKWTLPDGTIGQGGLVLPTGHVPGSRLPLVIQSYHFFPSLFLPDGENPTIDMAQSLASRGFAVLMMDAWPKHAPDDPVCTTGPACEGLQFVGRIDSAVAELDRRGLVDPNRVGTTGFSRGGMLGLFSIANPGKVRIAATVVADSFRMSLFSYAIFSDLHDPDSKTKRDEELFYGDTFWKARQAWLAYDPLLNADRIQTPALFFDTYPTGQLSDSRAVRGALRINRKPFDYFNAPSSPHTLILPAERIAILTRSLDWLCYWLKGEVDPNPSKAEQYERWAPLRQQQQKIIDASAGRDRPLPPLPELRIVPPERARSSGDRTSERFSEKLF